MLCVCVLFVCVMCECSRSGGGGGKCDLTAEQSADLAEALVICYNFQTLTASDVMALGGHRAVVISIDDGVSEEELKQRASELRKKV
jgi:hypothetical protein